MEDVIDPPHFQHDCPIADQVASWLKPSPYLQNIIHNAPIIWRKQENVMYNILQLLEHIHVQCTSFWHVYTLMEVLLP